MSFAQRAYDIRLRTQGPDHRRTLLTRNNLAVAQKISGHFEQAETVFRELFEINNGKHGPTHRDTMRAMWNLGDLYERWDKPDQAARWRTRLAESEALAAKPGS